MSDDLKAIIVLLVVGASMYLCGLFTCMLLVDK